MPVAAARLPQPSRRPALGVVRVLFFGRVADVCGRSLAVDIPSCGCPLPDLRARIAAQVGGAEQALSAPGLRVAVDQVMTCGEPWVSPGQEVAFLSAFSGG